MPWQQLVADVGTEYDPATGIPFWREIVVTVPRQSGKTTVVLSFELERAIGRDSMQKVAYTAQTGWDARRKLIDDQVPLVSNSPLRVAVSKVMRAAGNEAIIFKNGSRIDVLASSDSAGHGRTIDLAVIDEAFSDTDDRREQALLPAMATRADAQLLVVSTMGTEASVFLNRKIAAGRQAIADDADRGIAYIEWSAPDDADIDDPATWWACMPALGHTITEAVVAHARQTMSEGDFRRAYLNQKTVGDERVIPADIWNAACSDQVKPEGSLRFSVALATDRSSAAICVADSDSRAELVDSREGVSWVVDRVVELCVKWGAELALDGFGPEGSLADDIEARGVRVVRYSTREVARACGLFFDGVADGRVRVRRSDTLDAAVAGARRRSSGDAWVWARKDGGADVSPLVALTLALDRGAKRSTDLWVAWD